MAVLQGPGRLHSLITTECLDKHLQLALEKI
jgi:hypothetical protein